MFAFALSLVLVLLITQNKPNIQ